MAEYIEREEAIQAKPEFLNVNHENKEDALYAKGWNACNSEYIENLLKVPAADVRPVVRGKWERVGNTDHFKCTCCNDRISATWDTPSALINFCPNCGADMRMPKEG